MADEGDQKLESVMQAEAAASDGVPPAAEAEAEAEASEQPEAAEEDEAAARRAAIFDEDEDEHDDEMPSMRRRDRYNEVESADAAVLRKKKKKRYHSPIAEARAPQEDAQEETHMTEAELRKFRTDKIIEDALRGGKKKAPRKRAGEDDLDLMADEEVSQLRTQMVNAADEDYEANKEKRPATNKLRLLPKVVATLQKNHLQQSILDNNLLEGVKRWLEPLPDKSLPALNIQHQFFQILTKMTIDTISLKMSGLGKVVVFYSMCTRVDPAIKRSAEHLIEVWSRPVLKRSSSYRDRHVQSAEWNPDPYGQRSRTQLTASQDSGRRNVGIPQAVSAGFRVAPQSSAGQKSDSNHEARQANHQRLNRFKSRLKEAKR